MLRKLLARYNSWKLGHKLLAAFVLVSIVPILFVQIVAFQMNRNQMTAKIDELMVNNLTQIAERVDLSLQIYMNLLYQIYRDEQVIDNILKLEDDANSRKAVAYNQVVDCLKQYQNNETGIRCLTVVCPDGAAVVYDFQTDSSLNNVWQGCSDLRQSPPYQDAVGESGMVVTDTMRFEGDRHGRYFHISKRMFDFDHLDRGCIATVIMTIDETVLGDICGSREMEGQSINFIINGERKVIAYPDADFSGITMNPDLDIAGFVRVSGFLRKRSMIINQYEDPVTGWIFCNAYDKEYMLQEVTGTQQIQVMVTVLVLLFASALILYTVHTMDVSVRSVVFGMREVKKGNLDVVVPVRSFDEIGTIADNFNDMTVKVRELIEEVSGAKERQKNAEIQALEAQINPHFLYNTLDSINWMAIEKGEFEISKMLRNLGVILRYSVNKSNQTVTIRELSDWLGKYISLQQMRFDNAFSYESNIDERVYEVRVYKLLLQPFVENAILHGFREMESGGLLRIDISFSKDGRGITVIIEDNGKGMPAEILADYNDRERAVHDDGRGIGLHNAFARISMYYGEEASWNVSSIPGMGTVITLRLPLLLDGNIPARQDDAQGQDGRSRRMAP